MNQNRHGKIQSLFNLLFIFFTFRKVLLFLRMFYASRWKMLFISLHSIEIVSQGLRHIGMDWVNIRVSSWNAEKYRVDWSARESQPNGLVTPFYPGQNIQIWCKHFQNSFSHIWWGIRKRRANTEFCIVLLKIIIPFTQFSPKL